MGSHKHPKTSGPFSHLVPNFQSTSFNEAISVIQSPTAPNIYLADIKRDWCIGLVPHGGYLTSVISRAVSTYFENHHADLNQPDLITFHVEFLTRTAIGPVKILIIPLKLGRQFSTIRAQLIQPDPKTSQDRTCLEILVTQGNLTSEAANGALSLPTRSLLTLPPRKAFEEQTNPSAKFATARPAAVKLQYFQRPGSQTEGESPEGKSFREQWVRWKPQTGGALTIEALGFLTDSFRPVPENYGLDSMWYPTLNYGIDVKRRRNGSDGKEAGWEWLYVKAEMTESRNGRFGIDVLVVDEEGEIVATSRHVALIVSAERNTNGRTGGVAKI